MDAHPEQVQSGLSLPGDARFGFRLHRGFASPLDTIWVLEWTRRLALFLCDLRSFACCSRTRRILQSYSDLAQRLIYISEISMRADWGAAREL